MLPSWLGVILLLLNAGLVLAVGVVLAMARTLLQPGRMSDGKAVYLLKRLSPADLGLPYEQISYQVRDAQSGGRIRIAGWWIAHPQSRGRTALLIHGYGDAKVGGIAWAPTFHELGWNVLAIDLRAHGDSGGRHSTAGFHEREDVRQVLDELISSQPAEARQVVLFGVSLGAAVALAGAAGRDDIAGVVLESPFADYRQAVAAHGEILGMPGGLLQRAGVRLAEWISGADFSAVRPVDLIEQARCPIMLIQPADDPFVPEPEREAMRQAVERHNASVPGGVVWRDARAGHVLMLAADSQEYRRKLGEFLDACTSRGTGAGDR
jgi:hypothetical protein